MAQASRYGDTQRGSVDDEFQSFPDYESGRRAQRNLWKTREYQKRTVRAAIKRWSPYATEDHVNEMLAAANASNGEKSMREVSDTELNALMDVQQRWEGWIPPTATTPASRSYNNNNPGNIKRTDTMRQDPTPSARPIRTGDPADTGQGDADKGRVKMAYDRSENHDEYDPDLKAKYGPNGTVGPIWVINADRQAAFDSGYAIWAAPVEPTVDPVEPVNWRGHVSHAVQRAGLDSPSNAFNTLAEGLPTAGAIIGGGVTSPMGAWGAIPGYAAGQGFRELIQNWSDIIPGIADVAGHITSSADSPGPFIQDRPDIHPSYSGVPPGVTEDPYAGRTFGPPMNPGPSPRQAAWDAFKRGVMGDIVNLVPGARRGRQALQSLDEGNPWTAGTQGVIAALDAASAFGGGAIAQGIKATPIGRNLLAASAGGTGSAVGGELAGHAGEDWLDLTPDQQYALSALGEFGGGGVAGGLAHPSSRQVMGDIVTHPVVAATGAGLAASAHMPPQAAAGVAALSGIAAAAARRRTRDAGTAERRAQQTAETAATREATRQRERAENQARADTREETRQRERGETQAIAAERAVTRDAQWDATGRERIAAAKTIAEAREAQQAHNRQAALDKTLNAETAAALRARAAAETRARIEAINAANRADARAERRATRIASRAERDANRITSQRIANENRAEAMRVAAGRAEVADAHWAETQRDRIANAQTQAEIRRENFEFKRQVRADRNATNARKEQYQKIADETARARQEELTRGYEAGDAQLVVRSSVTDEGVKSTTTQRFGPEGEELGGGIGESGIVDAGDVRTRPESARRGDPAPQEPTSPASPASATPDLSESAARLVDEYDLSVSQSRNLAEPLRKRYEELATKRMLGRPLSEAEFNELSGLRARFTEAGSDIGRGFQVAGSPGSRTLLDPTIIDRARVESDFRRGRR
jgi:hypothetical protein